MGCDSVTAPVAAASGRKPATAERMDATPAPSGRNATPPVATDVGVLPRPSAIVSVIESAVSAEVASVPMPVPSLTTVTVSAPPPRRTTSPFQIEVPVGVCGVPIET